MLLLIAAAFVAVVAVVTLVAVAAAVAVVSLLSLLSLLFIASVYVAEQQTWLDSDVCYKKDDAC